MGRRRGVGLGPQQPEQPSQLGDRGAALLLDGLERLAGERALGGPRVLAHPFDGAADDLERVAGDPGAFLGDHAGGDPLRVARRQLGGGRRRVRRPVGAAAHQPAARPRGGEDEEHEDDVRRGGAVDHRERRAEREHRRVAGGAARTPAERVGREQPGGQRRRALLGDAG
jgi:hypothetical protein